MRQEKVLATLVIIIFSMICLGIIFTQNLFSAGKPFELRINVGGERIVDTRGNEWLKDHIYRSGYGYMGISGTYATREAILGTSIPEIYQSERYKLYGYRADVPNGHFEIILHFAEIYHERRNKRIMEVKIEDVVVEKNLDIYDRVGKNVALALVYNTRDLGKPITDKCIDIEIINKKDDTKLSGIEIIQMVEQPTILEVEPKILDFGINQQSQLLKISNIGTIPAMWRFDNITFPAWLRLPNPRTGKIKANSFISIPIDVDRSKIRGGLTRDTLRIVASEFEQKIPISVVVPGVSRLNIVNPTLEFGTDRLNLTCLIRNDGGSKLTWRVDNSALPPHIERVYPSSGNIEIGESYYLNVIITRKGLPAGIHTENIVIRSENNDYKISAIIEMPATREDHIFVNSAATGLNNGSSWEDAFITVKDAIANVHRYRRNRTTEIWVAQGTYYEYNILVPTGVQLYGGFTGNETVREERTNPWVFPTIIDAGRRGRCFECLHKTVIDGFVIQNGRDWNSGEGKGAAILTYDADIKIRNNLIRKNVDSWAGAIFIEGFDRRRKVANASPLIEYNVLIDNFSNYCAAAIELRGSAATIRNNTIVGNKGFGLEIQDLLGPYREIIYGNFYNNIITDNVRQKQNDVWAEARKSTNYSYVGKCWNLEGKYKPYDYGEGNLFGDVSAGKPGFIDEDSGDFRLRENSICINSGHPNFGADPDGSRADMGAFPFDHQNGSLEIQQRNLNFNPDITIRSVTIKAYGGKPVKWQASCYPDNEVLITIRPSSGELHDGEEAVLTFSYIPSGLPDGIYNGHFAFATSQKSYEGTWSILVNNSSPIIKADVAEVVIEQEIGAAHPTPQRIRINNSGYGSLDWKAKKRFNQKWLDFSELSGMNVDMLTLMFNTSNLTFGEYYEEIIISDVKTANKQAALPVRLKMVPGKFVHEVEAEQTHSLPNDAWKIQTNDGSLGIQAMKNSLAQPDVLNRLDYEFTVPEDVEFVYVFAEVDVNSSRSNDSFWVSVNGFDPCLWDNVNSKYDGWSRAWVYHQKRDRQHMFVVRPGKNTLNLYTRESGGFINWFVISNDPNINIQTYQFGAMTHAIKNSNRRR